MKKTHYDNLHVSRKAPTIVIKAAYRTLAQKWHPDKNPDDLRKAERYFQIIRTAYEVLSDPVLREEHDRWIDATLEREKAKKEKEEQESLDRYFRESTQLAEEAQRQADAGQFDKSRTPKKGKKIRLFIFFSIIIPSILLLALVVGSAIYLYQSNKSSSEMKIIKKKYFHKILCTRDCSGHVSGFNWAKKNNLSQMNDCIGNSQSFIEGCKIYIKEK